MALGWAFLPTASAASWRGSQRDAPGSILLKANVCIPSRPVVTLRPIPDVDRRRVTGVPISNSLIYRSMELLIGGTGAMDQFSYVVGLLSIITGLALSDMGISLHRLLKRRSNVQWDWMTLAIAGYVAFVIVRFWYQVWSIRGIPGVTGLFFFLGIIAENFVLFLIAASSLPDEHDLGSSSVDLRAFQRENSPYLWRLFTLFTVMWAAHGLYFAMLRHRDMSLHVALIFIVPLLLSGALSFVRERKWQIVLFAALVAHEAWWMVAAHF